MPAWASSPSRTPTGSGRALAEVSQRARERMDADRVSGSLEQLGSDEEAFTGSVGIPVQADAFSDSLPAPSESNVYGEGEAVPSEENAAEASRS